MNDWPHAPVHRMLESGAIMLTVGTYGKAHVFQGIERTKLLHDRLLEWVAENQWEARAWAVFSNHYHIVLSGITEPKHFAVGIARFHGRLSHEINGIDNSRGRKVFSNYWDSNFRDENSYLARMRYVMQNPVTHRLVEVATEYPYCSAAWFERTAPPLFVRTLESFKIDRVGVPDDYDPV